MIYDVSEFPELQCNETDYWKIIEFFKKFPESYYKDRKIYYEAHHIYPKGETQKEIKEFVFLPIKYHFLAHYYKALNATSLKEKMVNYNACRIMLGKSKCHKNFNMSKIEFDPKIYISKQILSEFNYRTKKVINLETMEIYNSVGDAANKLGISRRYVTFTCFNPEKYYSESCYKTRYLAYYDETKDDDYYKELYEKYKAIPKKKKKSWSKEAIKKRANKVKGKHFVQSKSKKVKDLNSGKVYSSTSEAERLTGIERHKILLSCRECRIYNQRNGVKVNFRYID